ncbi:hypothetical protein BH24ACT12_BH24ACT12_29290 [soil metagenome]
MRFLANVDPRFVVSFHQPFDATTVELPASPDPRRTCTGADPAARCGRWVRGDRLPDAHRPLKTGLSLAKKAVTAPAWSCVAPVSAIICAS